jgi:hypothetical protein
MKTLATTLVATGLLVCPAAAQTSSPAPGASSLSGAFIAEAPDTLVRASKLVGLDVIGLDEHAVGDIREVLLTREGQVDAVVIGVGGFLGMGEKSVAVPFDAFLWNTGDVSPAAGPSATVKAGTMPERPDAAGAAERAPGAKIGNEVLATTAENRSARVDAATGPATTASTGQGSATTLVVAPGNAPRRAVLRLTKEELKSAPDFRFSDASKGKQ